MAKQDKQSEAKDDGSKGEASETNESAPKQGFAKKLMGRLLGSKKMMLISGGALLVLLLGTGAGLYFFVFSAPAPTKVADQIPATPPQVAYYDVPDLIVNIQSPDGTAAYLKLSVALEIFSADEKAGLDVLKPRIVDQFESYLRELRVDDLKGSAGVLRLKEELLRRVNAAAAPYKVRDVLLKEMIVQ